MKRTADNYGGISSAAVKKATGKTWREWLGVLDKAGAAKLPHKDIVQRLQRAHRLADWWGQMVAVGYEQARGLRVKHQKPDGFEISVAKTIAAPVELPVPDNLEFTRVRMRVEYLKADDALAYTSGSALRDDVKSPGYFVFSPVLLPSGQLIVVNRGYTPDRSYPRPTGSEEIVGAIRWPEAPSSFVTEYDSASAIWFARDHRRMAAVNRWGDVAPFYIEQEAPVPPGGLPHPAALKVRLRNDHLQYALTWYSLAAVLVVIFAVWVGKRRPEGHV